ncbi:MAG: helix-turn-helix domain-containing protein [Gemmataceae bacterium]|nr:helix-turn-helix domain-containing protein [Gemmataceae bacterium]
MAQQSHPSASPLPLAPTYSSGEVCRLLGIPRPTLLAWVAAGKFPQPIRLSAWRLRWPRDVVQRWLRRTQQGMAEGSSRG